MKNNPLVSIIIPTYNRAHLIGETLDSIVAQTYENWECIIVDDGSTDNTEEIVNKYIKKDKRFQYHSRPNYHKPGGNGARNYGFKMSKGEYVNWFDSDDLMLNFKLSNNIEAFSLNEIDCVISRSCYINERKEFVSFWNDNFNMTEDIFNDFILKKIGWSINDPLWKKSVFLKKDYIFDERLKNGQDFLFHIEMLDHNLRLFFDTEVSVNIRIHDNRILNNSIKSISKCKLILIVFSNYQTKLIPATDFYLKNLYLFNIANLYKIKEYKKGIRFSIDFIKYKPSFKNLLKLFKMFFFGGIYYITNRFYSYINPTKKDV